MAMVRRADEPDVRLITNVVDVSIDDIRVGLPVEVFFED
ncbi:putative OB-fold protein [Mycobacterium sp. OAS707]|nr:putative OB-fold protein [Mycobacterium sp. OAS707]